MFEELLTKRAYTALCLYPLILSACCFLAFVVESDIVSICLVHIMQLGFYTHSLDVTCTYCLFDGINQQLVYIVVVQDGV